MAARSRTAGATSLAVRFPHARDALVFFDEGSHVYTINGTRAPRTVSGVAARCFAPFNPGSVIARSFSKWAADPSSRYHGIISACANEAEAKDAIARTWRAAGASASAAGTAMHAAIECELNGAAAESAPPPHALPPLTDPLATAIVTAGYADCVARAVVGAGEPETPSCEDEMRAWRRWWEGRRATLVPLRTEMSIYSDADAPGGLIAGQLDCLFAEEQADGAPRRLVVADWKRTAAVETEGFGGRCATHPAVSHLPDCAMSKFLIQTSLYGWVLRRYYGMPVFAGLIVRVFGDAVDEHPLELLPDATCEAILRSTA